MFWSTGKNEVTEQLERDVKVKVSYPSLRLVNTFLPHPIPIAAFLNTHAGIEEINNITNGEEKVKGNLLIQPTC